MIVNKQLAESKGVMQKDMWATPDYIYLPLNAEFNFTLDPCCTPDTAKCQQFYTEKENGLEQDWDGHTVFVNPPYSRFNIDKWVKKCFREGCKPNTVVVALLPVSTSAEWFHKWVLGKAELRFVRRRIRFIGAPFTAPFSSVIAIFNPTQP